ncbi:MAG TPA: helix-turn-helix domain-containing protein [Flavisolibacter sp.]|nr:helix-turn-helix domain-containing protein [Flavisolibacter sp.]
MAEHLYITRDEWNQMQKHIAFLTEFVKNSLKQSGKSRWVSPQEAMELIGCKKTKLAELRYSGELEWKTLGHGKGVMILRKSIDEFIQKNSTQLRVA